MIMDGAFGPLHLLDLFVAQVLELCLEELDFCSFPVSFEVMTMPLICLIEAATEATNLRPPRVEVPLIPAPSWVHS